MSVNRVTKAIFFERLDSAIKYGNLEMFDNYMYIMHDQDGYFEIAEDFLAYLTDEEQKKLDDGEFPKWMEELFDEYELRRFGKTVAGSL